MTCPIRFDGRVALVTGAGRGLGRQYAMDLGVRGASVIINDVDEAAAIEVMQEVRDSGGRAIAAPGSVDSYATACRAVELAEACFGGLDIVVANAGVLRDRTLLRMPIEDFDRVVDVHLRGTAYIVHAAWPHLIRRRTARVVLTTSAAGLWGNYGQSNYCAAKLGVVGFMNALKLEGEKYGVAVNTVAPLASTQPAENVFPVGLWNHLNIADVAALVVWLCSERCDRSGELFEVGAGRIARAQIHTSLGVVMERGGGPEQVGDRMQEIFAQQCGLSHRNTWDAIRQFIEHLPIDTSRMSWPQRKGTS